MIVLNGNVAAVDGAMTLETAKALLKAGEGAISASASVFDLAQVTAVDSSALAIIFGWMRAAQSAGRSLSLSNPPQNLFSLADVYGVRDLLPAA